MKRNSVSIPGDVLDSTVIAGLTFMELAVLGSIPIIIVFPATYLEFVPTWVLFAILGLGFLFVGSIVVKSPPGQTPLEWFPSYIKRVSGPDKYRLRRRDHTPHGSRDRTYEDILHTAAELEADLEGRLTKDDVDEMVAKIDHAEKLDRPDWAIEETSSFRTRVFRMLRRL